jgi:transcriptional regulator with XRE-family HTH domain
MRIRDSAALRAYLRLLGLSERALAARAGVAHATVNHLLSGRRRTCSPETAAAIEAALACPPGVFFEAAGQAAGPVGLASRVSARSSGSAGPVRPRRS